VIARGAGWTDPDRRQPVGDTGRHEPLLIDAIVDAELQRALDDTLERPVSRRPRSPR
jgi:hypothetical protein